MELAIDIAVSSVITGVSLGHVPSTIILSVKTGQFLWWVSFKASVPSLFFCHPDVF